MNLFLNEKIPRLPEARCLPYQSYRIDLLAISPSREDQCGAYLRMDNPHTDHQTGMKLTNQPQSSQSN